MNNKFARPVESFLVGKTLPADISTLTPTPAVASNFGLASIAVAGRALVANSSGVNVYGQGNVNLYDGQIGIVDVTPTSPNFNNFLGTNSVITGGSGNFTAASAAVDNITASKGVSIQLVQGTAFSSNTANWTTGSPLVNRPYESSPVINPGNTLRVTKQAYRAPALASYAIGSTATATAGNFPTSTLFQLALQFKGRRMSEQFSSEESAYSRYTVTVPSTITAGALAADYVFTNMAWQINRNSVIFNSGRFQGNDPVFAVLLGAATGSGNSLGNATAIASLTAGSTINIVRTATGFRTITLTAQQLVALQAAAVSTGLTHALCADVNDAGVTTSATSAGMAIIAIDEPTAFVDFIPQTKVDLMAYAVTGFGATVPVTKSTFADPGQGVARDLNLLYTRTQGQRKYTGQHTIDPVINYPSPFDLTATYNTYAIHHSADTYINNGSVINSPFITYVCVPSGFTQFGLTTAPVNATNSASANVTSAFDYALNLWLSANDKAPISTI